MEQVVQWSTAQVNLKGRMERTHLSLKITCKIDRKVADENSTHIYQIQSHNPETQDNPQYLYTSSTGDSNLHPNAILIEIQTGFAVVHGLDCHCISDIIEIHSNTA